MTRENSRVKAAASLRCVAVVVAGWLIEYNIKEMHEGEGDEEGGEN